MPDKIVIALVSNISNLSNEPTGNIFLFLKVIDKEKPQDIERTKNMAPRPSKEFNEGKKPERADWSEKRGEELGSMLENEANPRVVKESEKPHEEHIRPKRRFRRNE